MKLLHTLSVAACGVALLATATAGTVKQTTYQSASVIGNPFFASGYTGTTSSNLWNGVSNSDISGTGGFPGLTPWSGKVSNSASGVTSATLNKVITVPAGSAYAASASIYFGGTSMTSNTNAGSLSVREVLPAGGATSTTDVTDVTFQAQFGEALLYDFYSPAPATFAFPVLTYKVGGTTYTATRSYSIKEKTWNNNEYDHDGEGPEEPQDIVVNTWRFKWDLSGAPGPITEFTITWSNVQHCQLYGLKLDQKAP